MQVVGDHSTIEQNGELADAMLVLRKAGKKHDDYRIEVRQLGDKRGAVVNESTVKYKVIVTDLKTEQATTFDGGHRNAWVAQLARSLAPNE
jgi:hypothetical protein